MVRATYAVRAYTPALSALHGGRTGGLVLFQLAPPPASLPDVRNAIPGGLSSTVYRRSTGSMPISSNRFADSRSIPRFEAQLGFSLREPYILVPDRARRVGPFGACAEGEMIRALSEPFASSCSLLDRAMLTSFRDSLAESCIEYRSAFPEQASLIIRAHCVSSPSAIRIPTYVRR